MRHSHERPRHCLERPGIPGRRSGPTFQCNWTCHEWPPVLRNHICMANGVVFQDTSYCISPPHLWLFCFVKYRASILLAIYIPFSLAPPPPSPPLPHPPPPVTFPKTSTPIRVADQDCWSNYYCDTWAVSPEYEYTMYTLVLKKWKKTWSFYNPKLTFTFYLQ